MSRKPEVCHALGKRPVNKIHMTLAAAVLALLPFAMVVLIEAQTITTSPRAHDPGVRTDAVDAGQPFSTLTPNQAQFFSNGQSSFLEVDAVPNGLGPTFNALSCGSCHSQPATGGTSPRQDQFPFVGPNPQIEAATDNGGTNTIPFFVSSTGPVREARFPFVLNPDGTVSTTPDGGVHDIFTLQGRADATNVVGITGQPQTCTLPQQNFNQMKKLNNIIFRVPTPTFGAGLIENISEQTIINNMNANAALKQSLGIAGHPNRNGNDGTIARFGWKAQNKSLELFAGEAYNVEQGVSNEVFQSERGFPPNPPPVSCLFNGTPEDHTNFDNSGAEITSDVVGFSNFMRFLDQPTPSSNGIPGSPPPSSIANGRAQFSNVHCDMCHTPALATTASSLNSALHFQNANLFSDLLVHHMGSGLADGVGQGGAGPDEFRTAPLWGVGQRVFFLHDGRATPDNGGLLTAIQAHASNGSEANAVINLFNSLSAQNQQDLLNFLRSL